MLTYIQNVGERERVMDAVGGGEGGGAMQTRQRKNWERQQKAVIYLQYVFNQIGETHKKR